MSIQKCKIQIKLKNLVLFHINNIQGEEIVRLNQVIEEKQKHIEQLKQNINELRQVDLNKSNIGNKSKNSQNSILEKENDIEETDQIDKVEQILEQIQQQKKSIDDIDQEQLNQEIIISSKLREENEIQRRQLESQDQELIISKQRIFDHEQTISNLQNELQAIKDKIENYENIQLEKQLNRSMLSNRSKKSQIQFGQFLDVDQLSQQSEDEISESELYNMKKNLQKLTEENEILKKNLKDLQEEQIITNSKVVDHEQTIQNLRDELQEKKNKIENYENIYQEQQANKSILSDRSKRSQNYCNIDQFQDQQDEEEEQIFSDDDQILYQQHRQQQNQHQIKEQEFITKINELQEKLKQLEEQNKSLQDFINRGSTPSPIQNRESDPNKYSKIMQEREKLIQDLQNQLFERDQSNIHNKSNNQFLFDHQDEENQVGDDLAEAKNDYQNDQQEQIKHLASQNDDYIKKISHLEEQHKKISAQLDTFQQDKEQQDQIILNLQNNARELENQNKELRTQLQELKKMEEDQQQLVSDKQKEFQQQSFQQQKTGKSQDLTTLESKYGQLKELCQQFFSAILNKTPEIAEQILGVILSMIEMADKQNICQELFVKSDEKKDKKNKNKNKGIKGWFDKF